MDQLTLKNLERLLKIRLQDIQNAIIVCGTTGEASTMDDDEHLATIKYCVEKVAGRIPVIREKLVVSV